MFMPSPCRRRGLHCIIPWKRVLCYIAKRANALITIRIYRNVHFSDIDMPFDMILEALAIISTMCMIQPPANLVNWLTKILVLRDGHSTSYPNILRAINHQCECVVDYWLSKESSLAALWYWNWQCSYSISTANQNRKQTTCRSRSNNVTCLLILTNLEHRHQSILFWSTSIDQLAEHRKSSTYLPRSHLAGFCVSSLQTSDSRKHSTHKGRSRNNACGG